MESIATARLLLRPMRQDDLDTFAGFATDEETMRYMGGVLSREDTWRQMAMLIGHWELKGFGSFAVEVRETGDLIGRIGFHQPEGWPGFELGWMLGREFWGEGYATEAAQRLLDHGFNNLDKAHIISVIQPENERSIRLATRIGEKREGETEVRGIHVHVYGIHRANYVSNRR